MRCGRCESTDGARNRDVDAWRHEPG
jgi:hypothetical protein